MKAIVQDRYGSPDDVLELREIDEPKAKDDEVLVRVHASTVAIGDWLVLRGQPYFARFGYGLRRPKNSVVGFDVAGRVEAVGGDVERFGPGDEVYGWCDGALAELATAPQDALAPMPNNLTFEQAGTVPIAALAALQALRDGGEVQPGEEVLITGASGGVGTFAVQIAKAYGASVTGVCSTRNVELVRSIGADHVIDYTFEDIADYGRRYDLIVDIAGNRPLSELRRALTPKGRLVIVGGSGGPWFMGFGRTIMAMVVSPFVSQRLRPFFSKGKQEDLVRLKELIEAGKVTPVIDRTYPLSETPEALGHVGSRHTRGKTVITV